MGSCTDRCPCPIPPNFDLNDSQFVAAKIEQVKNAHRQPPKKISYIDLVVIPQQRLHTVRVRMSIQMLTSRVAVLERRIVLAWTVHVDPFLGHVRRRSFRSQITECSTLVVQRVLQKGAVRMVGPHVVHHMRSAVLLVATQIWQSVCLVVAAVIIVPIIFRVVLFAVHVVQLMVVVARDVVVLLNVFQNGRRHVQFVLMLMQIRGVRYVRVWQWIR